MNDKTLKYDDLNGMQQQTNVQPKTNNMQAMNYNGDMSLGSYIALIMALVASGFALVFIGCYVIEIPAIAAYIPETTTLTVALVALALSIGGIVVQYFGAQRESIPMCIAGFYIISCVFGVFTAMALRYYDIPSITAAIGGTVAIAVVFGILGFLFPTFFSKIHGLLIGGLVLMIIVEIVLIFFGISQGVTDWIVLAIFCGLIGYDLYKATHVETTKMNAILYATSIYLDLLNIFMRLLSIFGRRR